MQVQQYTFQSPSPQQVQIGRPDASSVKQEQNTSQQSPVKEQSVAKAEAFVATQKTEVTPSVSSNKLLDVYA